MHARRITLLPPRSFRVFSLTQLTFFFDRIRVQDDIVDGIAGIVPYLFVLHWAVPRSEVQTSKEAVGWLPVPAFLRERKDVEICWAKSFPSRLIPGPTQHLSLVAVTVAQSITRRE